MSRRAPVTLPLPELYGPEGQPLLVEDAAGPLPDQDSPLPPPPQPVTPPAPRPDLEAIELEGVEALSAFLAGAAAWMVPALQTRDALTVLTDWHALLAGLVGAGLISLCRFLLSGGQVMAVKARRR